MGRFREKIVLVTGGTSGIGKAVASAFLKEGAKVAICGTDIEKGQRALNELDPTNSNALFVKTDVSNSNEVFNLISEIVRRFGDLHIAINNAGIAGLEMDLVNYPEEEWHKLIQTNITGVFLCMKYELQHMLKKEQGVIINMSSALGLRGKEKFAPYSASKHAILGLTKSTAFEYGKNGIRINAICPGAVLTEMDDAFYKEVQDVEEVKRNRLKSYALGRMGNVEEIANSILWLASDDATFVTGAAISIDGGKTAL